MAIKIYNKRNLINPNNYWQYAPCLCENGVTYSTNCCRRRPIEREKLGIGGTPVPQKEGAFSAAFSSAFKVGIL